MNFEESFSTFETNLESVSKLINFDKEVQEFAIGGVQKLHDTLKRKGIDNPSWNGERTLELLRTLRTSSVLETRYIVIYNQAAVLLVSYFGSALGDIFRKAAARSIVNEERGVLDAELKIRVSDIIKLSGEVGEKIGDLLIQRDGITFQDMQSTHRAFKQYFGIEITMTDSVRNIIVGQACRNAIVHDGAIANSRIINQIRNANPRTLMPTITLNERINFTVEDIDLLARDMRSYVKYLVKQFDDD